MFGIKLHFLVIEQQKSGAYLKSHIFSALNKFIIKRDNVD